MKLAGITILSILLWSACKKEQLTPDGKPSADARNNMVRIDASAAAGYWMPVLESNPHLIDQNPASAPFYLLKNDLTTPFECAFKGTHGDVITIEVYTTGPWVSCDIYDKGLKVTGAANSDMVSSHNTNAPSHGNLTYQVPAL